MKKTALLLLVALVLGWAGCSSDSTVEVKNLRLEMKENPLGINVTQPRFSLRDCFRQTGLEADGLSDTGGCFS